MFLQLQLPFIIIRGIYVSNSVRLKSNLPFSLTHDLNVPVYYSYKECICYHSLGIWYWAQSTYLFITLFKLEEKRYLLTQFNHKNSKWNCFYGIQNWRCFGKRKGYRIPLKWILAERYSLFALLSNRIQQMELYSTVIWIKVAYSYRYVNSRKTKTSAISKIMFS